MERVTTPPLSVIPHPVLLHVLDIDKRTRLSDTASYGSALRKFYVFCDTFSILESDCLSASFALLHSFALWVAADPDPRKLAFRMVHHLNRYQSMSSTSIYLGFALFMSSKASVLPSPRRIARSSNFRCVVWQLRTGRRKRPLRPPITLLMLWALRSELNSSIPSTHVCGLRHPALFGASCDLAKYP